MDELSFDFTPADLNGCPCAELGWIPAEWVFGRAPRCTCGAGDPNCMTVLHDIACDCVPCPFCPLEATYGVSDDEPGGSR